MTVRSAPSDSTSRASTTPRRPTPTPCRPGFWPVWSLGTRFDAAASCPTTAATFSRCGVGAPAGAAESGTTTNRRAKNMTWTRAEIHEATNFDAGDLFQSEAQVRAYFTVENMRDMFGECPYTQEELDEMAEEVIRRRWHMVLPVEEYKTVYTDVFGVQLEAIQLPWSVVRSILGR